MGRLLLALALALGTLPARADWVPIGASESSYEYLDLKTLRVNGDLRRIWVLDDLSAPDKDGDRSYRTLLEYDCRAERYRSLQGIFYAGSMATGRVTARTSQASVWRKVMEGTISATVMKAVCSRP
jgi:hypothetical protein